MNKIKSLLLVLLLGSIGLSNADSNQAVTNNNSNDKLPTESLDENKIEVPKNIIYRYFLLKRAFEGLGKRNGVYSKEENHDYLSNEYNKRAFEGLGKRNNGQLEEDDEELFSNEYNKRAFEGLGKRSIHYRVFKKQFEGLGK